MSRSAHAMAVSMIALASVAAPAPAGAQSDVTSTLSWSRASGAEACPTVIDVAGAVEALLGRRVLVEASTADRIVEATVAPDPGGGFVAQIRVTAPDGTVLGERTLSAVDPTCADMLERASLTIALMIDPEAEDDDRDADASDASEDRASEGGASEEERGRIDVFEPAPALRFTLDLTGHATFGLGPFVSGAGALYARLLIPGFVPIGVVGIAQPFSRAEASAGPVDFTMLLGGVTICPLYFHDAQWSVGACAGVELGGALVVGNGRGEALRETERLLAQLDVHGYGRARLWGPLAVHVILTLLVPFRGEAWSTASGMDYYRPEPVAAMVGLGLSVDLTLAGDDPLAQHVP